MLLARARYLQTLAKILPACLKTAPMHMRMHASSSKLAATPPNPCLQPVARERTQAMQQRTPGLQFRCGLLCNSPCESLANSWRRTVSCQDCYWLAPPTAA